MSGGSHFGRYQIDEVSRAEPFGRVLRARLPEIDRSVYLREVRLPATLPAEDRARLTRAFLEECRLLVSLRDPRLAAPCDYGLTEAGTAFIAYDRPEAAGCEPVSPVRRGRPVPACLHDAAEMARALATLWAAGVVYYPFQPESFFVSPIGSIEFLHLGTAQLPLRLGLPGSRALAQDPYAAPEERAGQEITESALIFSLAAWLYAALSGDERHSPAADIAAGRQPEPLWIRNPGVLSSVDSTVQRALCQDPAARFPTLAAFAAALASATPAAPPGPALRPPTQEPGTAAGGGPEAATPLLGWVAGAVGLGLAGWLSGWAIAALTAAR